MIVKIKLLSEIAKIPHKQTEYSAGYDIYSANKETIILKPGKLVLVPTGFAISIPHGYEAQIRPRSGLALKNQIGVLNSPGTIDSDYRGEVKILLFNFGEEEFHILPNSRIAQMVITKHETVDFVKTSILDETIRNDGGFGHTNI